MMLLPADESREQAELIPARDSESWKGRAAGVVGGCLLVGAAVVAIVGRGTFGSDKSLKHLRIEGSTQLNALGQLSAAEIQQESNQLRVKPDRGLGDADDDEDLSPEADWNPHAGWPCREGEEIFFGKCYKSCEAETNGTYPHRNDECTCCMDEPCVSSPERTQDDCTRFNRNIDGDRAKQPLLPDCPYANEEIFEGLCFKKCSIMTKGLFPFRSAMNTCSNGKYGGNWTMGFGPCSGFGIGGTKCAPHIPMADGAGYSQDLDQMEQLPGRAPLGFKKLPQITAPEHLMEQVPEAVEKILASTPVPLHLQ